MNDPARLRIVVLIVLLGSIPAARGALIEFGNPPSGGNSFPFTTNNAGDRYQQVYNASFFSGPVIIDTISFFRQSTTATFSAANFEFRLSTSSKAVNGLDTSGTAAGFASNVGADDALFLSTHLSGSIGATVVIDGTDFFYDPSAGNLLLDIILTNRTFGGTGSMQARNGTETPDFGTDSSRSHNFNGGFTSYGLRTTFNVSSASAVPDGSSMFVLLGAAFALVVGLRHRCWRKR